MSDVKNLSLEQKLKLLEAKDKICDRVEAGEKVPCPKCGAYLVESGPGFVSEWADKEKQYGHGIFCPNDESHFARYIDYGDKV